MTSSNNNRRMGRISAESGPSAGARSATRWLLLGSITGNVALIVLCGILGMPKPAANQESVPSAPVSAAAPPAAKVAPPVPQPASSRPFHWSQVEADDYETYVANLKAIGCPEETIRNIVSSEIGAIYVERQRKEEAEKQRPLLPSELQKVQEEQRTVLTQLFPPGRRSGNPASSTADLPVRQPAVVYPLVYQNLQPVSNSQSGRSAGAGRAATGSPVGGKQNTASAETLDRIRSEFAKDFGPRQNPADPDYLERWTRAQSLADLRLRGMMGVAYYNAYTLELARQAVEAKRNQGR